MSSNLYATEQSASNQHHVAGQRAAAARAEGGQQCATADCAATLLQRAFEVLQHQTPEHANMLRTILTTLNITLTSNHETFSPTVEDGALAVVTARPGASVHATASLSLVVALLDDQLSLSQALRTRQLHIVGAIPQVRCTSRALRIFLHGLVRAPAGAALFSALRQLAQQDS